MKWEATHSIQKKGDESSPLHQGDGRYNYCCEQIGFIKKSFWIAQSFPTRKGSRGLMTVDHRKPLGVTMSTDSIMKVEAWFNIITFLLRDCAFTTMFSNDAVNKRSLTFHYYSSLFSIDWWRFEREKFYTQGPTVTSLSERDVLPDIVLQLCQIHDYFCLRIGVSVFRCWFFFMKRAYAEFMRWAEIETVINSDQLMLWNMGKSSTDIPELTRCISHISILAAFSSRTQLGWF